MLRRWVYNLRNELGSNRPWLIGAIAAFVALGLGSLGMWRPLERVGHNLLLQLRPQPGWDERIVVIGIDDSSLAKYGQFQSWSREKHIQLLEALETANPAVVGFDILFVDNSPQDEKLAEAIDNLGTVVLARTWDRQDLAAPLEPVEILAEVAANQGHILHQPDPDGVTRQVAIWVNGEEFSLPNLGLGVVEVYNAYLEILEQPLAVEELPSPNPEQLLQKEWINWPGSTKAVPTYSFVDVVEGKVDPKKLEDKLILVGFTATDIDDPLRTPFNLAPPTAGVYLHGAVIDNLLNDRFLWRLPSYANILFVLVIGPLASWLLFNKRLIHRLTIVLMLIVLWFALVLTVLSLSRLWLPLVAPVGTVVLTSAGVQLREQLEKQQLMDLFATYVAPETANLIWQQKDEFFQDGKLLVQELEATVLFMDIRGFTSVSEKMSPSQLFHWLNRYLDTMTDCIMEHGGVVDKYIGDAIMAVFGIPVKRTSTTAISQDAHNAIAASFAMYQRLEELNEELIAHNFPTIQVGIGIHSGPLTAGSLGSKRRLNYSVVGDTVNVASRLESMNKQVINPSPYKILVSCKTYSYICDRYQGQPVAEIKLKGREQTTKIYNVVPL